MVLNEKGIIRQFDIVVYPVKIVIVIGDLEDNVNKLYEPKDKKFNWLAPPSADVAEAVYTVVERKTGYYCLMVWIRKEEDCSGSFFCHECGHISLEIFKYVNAHIEYDNQEPFCYLLGTIFRLINGAYYELKDYREKKSKTSKKK